jgi:hypothetical protein
MPYRKGDDDVKRVHCKQGGRILYVFEQVGAVLLTALPNLATWQGFVVNKNEIRYYCHHHLHNISTYREDAMYILLRRVGWIWVLKDQSPEHRKSTPKHDIAMY